MSLNRFELRLRAAALAFACLSSSIHAQDVPAIIRVDAAHTRFRLSDQMLGANIEDLHHQMVGGLDSQLLHGESFFEPSPTELAPRRSQLFGFETVNGEWTVAGGILGVHVRPGDGTPSLEAGMGGGRPPEPADTTKPAKDPGARLTSSSPAPSDTTETRASFLFPSSATRTAALIAHVHPNHADNGWNWYSGYTVELDPDAQRVRLLGSTRASRHRELAAARTALPPDTWLATTLRVADGKVSVQIGADRVLEISEPHPLPVGRYGIVARGDVRVRDLAVDGAAVALRRNPLLASPGDALSLRWHPVRNGTARGSFAFDPAGWHPGLRSQQLIFESGAGEFGCDNAGLQRVGIALHAGRDYQGFLRVKTPAPLDLVVSLRGADGDTVLATRTLPLRAGDDYQRVEFSLTPATTDLQGRFSITLRSPGRVTVGYAFLQPGEWGRYKGLPVRKDLAEALVSQGIGLLRVNGGMIEVPGFRWAGLRGPRDQRPPYDGFYDRYCSSGFGPAETIAFAKAAGLPVIAGLNLDETPEDVADFVAACRPTYYQVANESRFDARYVERFKRVADAVWKVAPDTVLVTTSVRPKLKETDSEEVARRSEAIALSLDIAAFAHQRRKPILFDCHAFGGASEVAGIATYARWLLRLAPEPALVSVGILELNAGAFDFRRGLGHAQEMNAAYRAGDVIRALGTPNVYQPWEIYQRDWKAVLWTQGNIYHSPSKIWFQPAYHVDRMIADSPAPDAVECKVEANRPALDVFAGKSADGKRVVLRVVNPSERSIQATLDLRGFRPTRPDAEVVELKGADDDFNTFAQPEKIHPQRTRWTHALPEAPASRRFAPRSFTVITIE